MAALLFVCLLHWIGLQWIRITSHVAAGSCDSFSDTGAEIRYNFAVQWNARSPLGQHHIAASSACCLCLILTAALGIGIASHGMVTTGSPLSFPSSLQASAASGQVKASLKLSSSEALLAFVLRFVLCSRCQHLGPWRIPSLSFLSTHRSTEDGRQAKDSASSPQG
ncbi:hypothetical protein BKA64DRAFT_390396 [Cadophora sp. MPI-SDFR-AT-0126]|nr:hypothetical protein BKA64DRAFT_390396 [Leotiomycetes sp. MPI-SDFR-AT-0126]